MHLHNFQHGFKVTVYKTSQKIMEILENSPHTTIKDLSELLKISERAVKYQLENLKKSGTLKHIGSDKEGYWKV